ncbi:MAG: hypothetical protein ACRD0H_00260, partial [Actinomycetes bacterium]
EYVDAVGQIHRCTPSTWPVHQVAAFLQLHSRINAGHYAKVLVGVDVLPRPDADRAGNASALSDLPVPFAAELDMNQNGADDDGTVSWGESITVTRSTGVPFAAGCTRTSPVTVPVDLRPFRVPLEVGTTMPSRTLLHLEEDGGVARWAYGSTDLYVLLNLRHPALRCRRA